ncbi:Ldh family oxidoreductase [Brevibacterium casei]|nr:Ldh family oxidoreductase [Brevibacterium casei]
MRLSVDSLRTFGAAALASCGVPDTDAALTARSLVQADQRGIASHGLLRLPLYVRALESGGIASRPELAFVRDTGATAVLDGGSGLGQVVMQTAVDWSLDRTRMHGVSAIAVENSSHYGAGAFWTDQLAAAGLFAVLTSTTGPTVAVHGGSAKVIGTNPLTMTAPSAGENPMTLDMATSAGAFGKVIAARKAGRPIPAGWAVDAEGRETTDADAAAAGSLLAFGGHKGSGLAVLLEAFAGGLSSATFAYETQDIWDNPASKMNNGHLLIALDAAAFNGRTTAEAKVSALGNAIGASGDGVRLPGQIEYANEERSADALDLEDSTAEALLRVADDLGLPRPQ